MRLSYELIARYKKITRRYFFKECKTMKIDRKREGRDRANKGKLLYNHNMEKCERYCRLVNKIVKLDSRRSREEDRDMECVRY